jgi:hypothetical protein
LWLWSIPCYNAGRIVEDDNILAKEN